MKYWLMKSEPAEFSIQDLKSRKRWHWDGVRNYTARNYMRDQMTIGDSVIFYHSSCVTPGPAGIARVASLPYPDHTQFDPHSKYFDPRATKESPRWHMVDIEFGEEFSHLVAREELRSAPALRNLLLFTHNRLSITPLTSVEFRMICKMGK